MAEEQFIDPTVNYKSSKEGLNIRMICLMHLQSLGTLAKKEFKGGYWESKIKMVQGMALPEKYYVPDTFEEYSNGIDFLSDITFPYFDKDMVKAEEEYNNAMENIQIVTKDNKTSKEAIRIKRKYFRALNSFLNRNAYLEAKNFDEED